MGAEIGREGIRFRLADFVLLSLVGIGLYLAYVRPFAGAIHWGYIGSILGMSAAAVVCFQAADIYQVQIFRSQLRQMTRMISSKLRPVEAGYSILSFTFLSGPMTKTERTDEVSPSPGWIMS